MSKNRAKWQRSKRKEKTFWKAIVKLANESEGEIERQRCVAIYKATEQGIQFLTGIIYEGDPANFLEYLQSCTSSEECIVRKGDSQSIASSSGKQENAGKCRVMSPYQKSDISDVQNGKIRPTVQPIWWNDEISSLRREYIAARRKMTNARRKKNNDLLIEENIMEYKSIKNRLKNIIREAKKQVAHYLRETIDKKDSLADLPESFQSCTLSERVAEKSSSQPITFSSGKQENVKKCAAMPSCQECDILDVQNGKVRPTVQPIWWNDEISSLRREYIAARRKMTNARRKKNNDLLIEENIMEYKSIKNRLKNIIREAKQQAAL